MAPTFSRMPLDEFWRSGLLWQVNRAVLWPLGLALTVVLTEEGLSDLHVQRLEPFESITSGDKPGEEEERAERFEAWLRERLGERDDALAGAIEKADEA